MSKAYIAAAALSLALVAPRAVASEAAPIVIRSPSAAPAAGQILIRSPRPEAPVAAPETAPSAARPAAPATERARRPEAPPTVFELDDIAPAAWRVTARSNIRSAPGTDAYIVGGFERGDEVTVVGRVAGADWLAIDHRGKLAFLHANLASPGTAPGAGAVPAAPPSSCPVDLR